MQYYQRVCLNGHQATDSSVNIADGGYCEQCGAELIAQCPSCHYGIKGFYEGESVVTLRSTGSHEPVPNYCNNCGKPYPWTESAIESAKELIDLSELSDKNKEILNKSIPDLLSETPRTKSAMTKFKLFTPKLGSTIAGGIRDVIIDVCSESVKRTIWGS